MWLPSTSSLFFFGRGYFAVNGILLLQAILPLPFICVYIAVIATILVVARG